VYVLNLPASERVKIDQVSQHMIYSKGSSASKKQSRNLLISDLAHSLTLIVLNLKLECSNFKFLNHYFGILGVFLHKYENMTNSVAPDQRAPQRAL